MQTYITNISVRRSIFSEVVLSILVSVLITGQHINSSRTRKPHDTTSRLVYSPRSIKVLRMGQSDHPLQIPRWDFVSQLSPSKTRKIYQNCKKFLNLQNQYFHLLYFAAFVVLICCNSRMPISVQQIIIVLMSFIFLKVCCSFFGFDMLIIF